MLDLLMAVAAGHVDLAEDAGYYVLLVIMLQMSRLRLLHYMPCGSPRFRCVAYADREPHRDEPAPGAISIVPPSQYMLHVQSRRTCCPRSWTNESTQSMPFWCIPHVVATMRSQARFLPALAHASDQHAYEFSSGRLQWLVLVDDDSYVRPARSAIARATQTLACILINSTS